MIYNSFPYVESTSNQQNFTRASTSGLKYVYVIGVVGTSISPLLLVVERTLACTNPEKYNSKPLLVTGAIIIQVCDVITQTLMPLVRLGFPFDGMPIFQHYFE